MGIIDSILGKGVIGEKPLEQAGNLAWKLREVFKGKEVDPQTQSDSLKKLDELVHQINLADAQSKSWWQAGWRPFIGWIAGLSLGFYYIPQFSLAAYIWSKMCLKANEILPYPMASDQLMELVYALLGFGLYRSIEKLSKKD